MSVVKRKTTQKKIKLAEPKTRVFLQVKPLLVLCCVGLLYFAYINWQTLLDKLDSKPISSFALVGTPQYTTNADVRDMILKMGELKGFFGQDVDVIREQIESMPWIKGAVVRKIWPDRLSIWVAEYAPVAFWNSEDFVSLDGMVFKLPKDRLKNDNLPRLYGPDYQSLAVLDAWKQIFNELKSKGITLKAVSIDERGSWEIVVENDITLKLGRGEWKSKIDRFMTIYPQVEIPENKKIAYIDLRYKVGAAVSFADIN